MPVILLLLGSATTAAGVVLVAMGVTVRDGNFDLEIVTPGTIAAIGGLLLIGMGLAVRELRRIEQTMAVRSMLRPVRAGEAAEAGVGIESQNAPVRIPLPPRPKADVRSSLPSSNPALEANANVLSSARIEFPDLVRREGGPIVEAGTVTARTAASAAEIDSDVKKTATVGSSATGPVSGRIVPRLDVGARVSVASGRAKVFGPQASWSNGSKRNNQAAALRTAAPMVAADDTAPAGVAAADSESAPNADAHAAITILKSGVVDGMAYTLYSDGSIEAQLPQGTVRFGSINALRDHIEGGS